jgi:LysR family transcriptional regulator for metE and metH
VTTRDFRIGLELGSNEAIKEAVLRGAGFALLSAFTVRHDLESDRLCTVSTAGLELERDFYVAVARGRSLDPTAKALLAVLQDAPFQVAPRAP